MYFLLILFSIIIKLDLTFLDAEKIHWLLVFITFVILIPDSNCFVVFVLKWILVNWFSIFLFSIENFSISLKIFWFLTQFFYYWEIKSIKNFFFSKVVWIFLMFFFVSFNHQFKYELAPFLKVYRIYKSPNFPIVNKRTENIKIIC